MNIFSRYVFASDGGRTKSHFPSVSTSTTLMPPRKQNTLVIYRIHNFSLMPLVIVQLISPLLLFESVTSSAEHGTPCWSTSSVARTLMFALLYQNRVLMNVCFFRVAHSQFILVYNFAQAILHDKELKAQPALHRIMTTVFELFGTVSYPRSCE